MRLRVLSIGVLILVLSALIFGLIVVDRNELSIGLGQEKKNIIEKEYSLPLGFYFIKSTGESARLLKNGEELRKLTSVERTISGEIVAGFELPGLWYGEYEVAVDNIGTTIKLIVGNPANTKSLGDCGTTYRDNERELENCLAEVIPFMVKEIGGRETRDLLLNSYSNLVGNKTGCGPWLGAYAQAIYDQHGFVDSLNMNYLTCRFSYLHYIIAIDSLKEGQHGKLVNYCRGFQLNGVDLHEARDQCILGYAYAGIFTMNYSIEKMIELCGTIGAGYNDFSKNLCYEGVFGASLQKQQINGMNLNEGKSNIVYNSGDYRDELPTYEFCNTITELAAAPCYRYTLGNQIDENFYNKDNEYKIEWLMGINKHCSISYDKWNGCWYGLADASFKALGDKPFNSFASVPESLWITLVEICKDDDEISPRCIDRVTLDQLNKTFSEDITEKWCGFLLKTSAYTCNYEAIKQYKQRIAPANQYDPAARRVSDLQKK